MRFVSSWRFFLWRKGLSPLDAVGVINTNGSARRGWEGVRVHIGPHWAERVGRAPPGGVWVGVWFECRVFIENWKWVSNAGRRTKFAPVKSVDFSEFSSVFWDLKTLESIVKVNPVISWNGQNSFHRIFPSNSQDFTTPQISFEFSGFDYTSNIFLIKPLRTSDRKLALFEKSCQSGKEEARTGWSNVDREPHMIGRKSYKLNQSDLR